LKWFKIYHDGLDSSGVWGVDRLIKNKGKMTYTIPSCIADGQYLMRVELIGELIFVDYLVPRDVNLTCALALHGAQSYPGAQFYVNPNRDFLRF
jgi:cellulase